MEMKIIVQEIDSTVFGYLISLHLRGNDCGEEEKRV
jgi:hypothetical protein